jgi:aldehyde dehydrogenase (NAD(P)+)
VTSSTAVDTDTPTDALERGLAVLAERKDRWARLPIPTKLRYLEEVRELVLRHADEWVAAGAGLKGLAPDSPILGGEEWLGGPYPTVAWISDVMATLEAIRTGADPLAGLPVRRTVSGQTAVQVMPCSIYERLLLSGYEVDVWMEPGVTPQTLRSTIGSAYRRPDPQGRVVLVLGAGNVSAIPVLDTLYSLFADGDVVLLKMNPVNDAYLPVFQRVFEPLVRDGYVRIVEGGAETGGRLAAHDLVDAIHITGSDRTWRAIRSSGVTKPMRAELGGATPTIIVPGPWTDADLAYQAEHVATQKLHSSGHACVAAQVVVLPAEWDRTEEFLDHLRRALAQAPDRSPFYPGTAERLERFAADNPAAERLPGPQTRLLLTGVDPDSDHPAFREEFFGPVLVTTALPGADAAQFLRHAVDFANTRLKGNLGANLVVHPDTDRIAVERAVADLRYGCIGVNAWAGFAFLAAKAAWGAYPGNGEDDIESGIGFVHNALLFDRPQKNVVHAPFRPFPRSARHRGTTIAVKPPWFLTNRTALSTARQLTEFAAAPGARKLPGLFASALRG